MLDFLPVTTIPDCCPPKPGCALVSSRLPLFLTLDRWEHSLCASFTGFGVSTPSLWFRCWMWSYKFCFLGRMPRMLLGTCLGFWAFGVPSLAQLPRGLASPHERALFIQEFKLLPVSPAQNRPVALYTCFPHFQLYFFVQAPSMLKIYFPFSFLLKNILFCEHSGVFLLIVAVFWWGLCFFFTAPIKRILFPSCETSDNTWNFCVAWVCCP